MRDTPQRLVLLVPYPWHNRCSAQETGRRSLPRQKNIVLFAWTYCPPANLFRIERFFSAAPERLLAQLLLAKTSDVGDQILDLRVLQLAFVGGHFWSFALGDCFAELGVRHALHFGRGEILRSHFSAFAIGAVAHGAFGLVGCRRILRRC